MQFGKHLLFMCLIFSLVSCGQKSTVKTDVAPQRFADAFGDGKLIKQTVALPITTDDNESPLPDLGIFFGGLAKLIGNLAARMGAGRTEMYFHQPTPEFPDQIKEVRLKRVFFYIEPKTNGSRRASWINRIFRGKGNVDFDFINKLVLRVKPELADMKNVCLLPEQGKLSPQFPCNDPELTSERTDKYLSYFKQKQEEQEKEPDLSELEEYVVVKYDGKKRDKYIVNEEHGATYLFRTTRPGETRHYFLNRSAYKGMIENLQLLDDVIMVELKKDAASKNSFEERIAKEASYIDETLGVEQIEECNPSICLDVKVDSANLLPFLKRVERNGVYSNRIEAYIDAGKIPETFKLKGFIAFELAGEIGDI
jgi:hypothetical protein